MSGISFSGLGGDSEDNHKDHKEDKGHKDHKTNIGGFSFGGMSGIASGIDAGIASQKSQMGHAGDAFKCMMTSCQSQMSACQYDKDCADTQKCVMNCDQIHTDPYFID